MNMIASNINYISKESLKHTDHVVRSKRIENEENTLHFTCGLNLEQGDMAATQPLQKDEDRRWTEVLWSVVEEYMENTTLHGYRYLTEPGRHWIERFVWLIVHALAAWGVIFIILSVWEEYLNTPTVTTVETTNYPIWFVPFPAIAVCNINRISLSAAKRVASNWSSILDVDEAELLAMMRYLGRLYHYDDADKYKFTQLHKMLTKNGHSYNVENLMKELSPKCEDLLVRCMWLGKLQDCKEMFEFRKTMDGYCCTFNYLRSSDGFGVTDTHSVKNSTRTESKLRITASGYQMGLSVVLNPEPEDYYYPLIPSYGTKMMVYYPHDFPDTPSGGLIEKLVPLKSEVFYRLEATTVVSTPDVRSFSLEQRDCLFQDELSEEFAGQYSYSDCLMSCRVKSMLTLCHCVPFYLPARENIRDCTVLDIPCLARYREKWTTLRPPENIIGLEVEMEEALVCKQCLPSCSDTAYHVQTTSAPITKKKYDHSILLDQLTLHNHSVFHLFYSSVNSLKLKQDVLYYWYELLSNFGGICGLFVGFSLISVIEFFYFFTFRLFFTCRRETPGSKPMVATMVNVAEANGKLNLPEGELYWLEMRQFQANRPSPYGTYKEIWHCVS